LKGGNVPAKIIQGALPAHAVKAQTLPRWEIKVSMVIMFKRSTRWMIYTPATVNKGEVEI